MIFRYVRTWLILITCEKYIRLEYVIFKCPKILNILYVNIKNFKNRFRLRSKERTIHKHIIFLTFWENRHANVHPYNKLTRLTLSN